MTEPHVPDEFHVPERRTLLEASAIAAVIGAVVLVLFILPAEYGIDPTGFGNAIGIDGMAEPGPAPGETSVHVPQDAAFRADTVNITVGPRSGLEYKFLIAGGHMMIYSWNATAPLYFDFHGEPVNDTTGFFESYEDRTAASADGSFTAPFEGTHGWYWRNDSSAPVTVALRTAGHYEVVGIK